MGAPPIRRRFAARVQAVALAAACWTVLLPLAAIKGLL